MKDIFLKILKIFIFNFSLMSILLLFIILILAFLLAFYDFYWDVVDESERLYNLFIKHIKKEWFKGIFVSFSISLFVTSNDLDEME